MVGTLLTEPSPHPHSLLLSTYCAHGRRGGGGWLINSDLTYITDEVAETCEDLSVRRRAQHCPCPAPAFTSPLEHTRQANLTIANPETEQHSNPAGYAEVKPSTQHLIHRMHWTCGGEGCPAGMLGSLESKQKGRGMREGAEWPSLNLSPRQPQGCLEPPACQAVAPQSQRGG